MNTVFEGCRWIWLAEEQVNDYADFIGTFRTEGGQKVILRLSADSNYALYINGEYVYSGQYGDYPDYKVYDEFDITDLCRKGENRLAVLGYWAGESSFVYRKQSPGVIFEVVQGETQICVSNASVLCRRDRGYRSGALEKFTMQLGFSYSYDSCKDDGWKIEGEEGFVPASEREKECLFVRRPVSRLQIFQGGARLCAQGKFLAPEDTGTAAERMSRAYLHHIHAENMGNEFRIRQELPCGQGLVLNASPMADGCYAVVDTGGEKAGFLRFDFEVQEDCTVLIGFGEHLEDLRVRTEIYGRNFAVTYRAHKGRNRWCGAMRRLGLRYIQLHFYAKQVKLYDCGVAETVYPVQERPVRIRDRFFRKIYETGVRTLRTCMHEHYEDCPWREQAMYAMDSRNQMLFGYGVFGNEGYVRANLRLISHGLRPEGLLDMCFPTDFAQTIPSFSLYFVIALAEYFEHSADADFFEELLPVAERILQAFRVRKENGLIPVFREKECWNFYEWRPFLSGESVNTPHKGAVYDSALNLLYLYSLEKMAYVCTKTGRNTAFLQDEIAQLKQDTERVFYDDGQGAFCAFAADGSRYGWCQLPQALAVMAGAGDAKALCRVLKEGKLVPVSLSNLVWVYDALLSEDNSELEYVLDDIAEKFGEMACKGNGTFYETDGGSEDFRHAGSLCHGWSAVACYVFNKYAENRI